MDSIFDAINVRDLLSAHDLSDPTTPLSAPDLRLLIQRLESHSLQIRSKVQSYILSHRDNFESLFSVANDAVSQSQLLSDDLAGVLKLISDQMIDAEVREVVAEIREKREELRVKRELLGLVRTILAANEMLESVREALRNGRFGFAAEGLKELKVALRVSGNVGNGNGGVEDGEPLVYGFLRKEWFQCFDEIQEVLLKLMEKSVRFDEDLNQVEVRYHLQVENLTGVQLQTVLEAMDHEDVAGELLYSGILLFIKFIYRSICFQNDSWIRCFGRSTWPRIAELIISSFLSKVVPTDASKLPDFQKIVKCTIEFESALKDLKFISASDDNDSRLSKFADDVEVHFAHKKKTEIMSKARNLLLECDFSIPQEYTRKGSIGKNDGASMQSSSHVVDLLFLSERCLVSKAAKQLMELVHQTLQDVCLSSTRVALEFYRAARDAILLYEVVVPVKLERQLDGINQVAVLMHNDCLYLSQEILGLAFEYRTDFPSSLKEHAVFVDLAPRFQLLAEGILQRQVHRVIYNLKEAIDGADGFQNTHQMKEFESAKFSIEQVVFILEKVRIIWEPLLLPSTYRKSMSTVIESVFSRIARDILLLDDMAADETLQLQRLIHLMLENLSPLFNSLAAMDQKSHEFSGESLDNLIPSLSKIRKLSELLDMPLKSITASWENKELISCGFTITEVEDFIKAIFTDSPLRRDCLWKIHNANF
ncbi:centromere/kinetochore protein zw10 homolog isoform X2 [Arachis ipaensis]|uniref:centromere/kinetochore protein zw10 homolog isoform X2 n=1 Tax=Arachis ipaensis TaxID=130454 RepID=UPI0007AF1ED5|nr:centromere/kinetochore protein zw10 homolog isoform X2 [Arachis ipaensis]XP_029150398.1 centromere/kinetochore protein zw10 homolog isoform X2 [Arachis hypogaea]